MLVLLRLYSAHPSSCATKLLTYIQSLRYLLCNFETSKNYKKSR